MGYTYDQLKDLDPLPFWVGYPETLPTPEFVAVALACNPIDKALDYVNHAAAATGGFTWQLRRVGYLLLHPEDIEVPHAES